MSSLRATSSILLLATLLIQAAFASTSIAEDAVRREATAVRLDGSRVVGSSMAFGSETVRLAETAGAAEPVDLPWNELLSLEFPKTNASIIAEPVLEFANGDRIHADIVKTEEDVLSTRIGANALAVPLESLRGIAFRPLDPDDGTAGLLFREDGANDLVLLTNGDRLAGQFVELSETDLSIDVEGRSVLVPRDRVAAVAFSPDLTTPASIARLRQIVSTSAGWLTVRDLKQAEDGSWSGRTAFNERITWPKTDVERVQFWGGRAVPLSSLAPASTEFSPYFDRIWPVYKNRAVTGEPLVAGEETFATGLGVHSRCRVRYELDGKYESFHVVGGMAASAGSAGRVEFAIELDGKEVVRSGPISKDSEPLRVANLGLADVRSLVLTVDYGQNGDVLDRANWCDAVLVRSK